MGHLRHYISVCHVYKDVGEHIDLTDYKFCDRWSFINGGTIWSVKACELKVHDNLYCLDPYVMRFNSDY
eukprot:m.395536 g.395536  ORF g.395536 m.395536 type:complete len:69 (-) comp21102_c0_seq8:52-258(-)